MLRKSLSHIFIFGTIVLTAASSRAQTGSLSGIVEDEKKGPIPGAWVLYNKIRPLRRDAIGRFIPAGPGVNGGIQAGTDGRFLAIGLRAGDYYVCAMGTAANHLHSCEWGQEPAAVQVGSGQPVTNVVLVVRSGVIINIQVQDPNGRLAAGLPFVAGVISDSGHYARAELKSGSATNALYAVTVPKGTALQLFLDTQLDVSDQGGKPVDAGRPSLPVLIGGQGEGTLQIVIN
jgi:hypothetical protein